MTPALASRFSLKRTLVAVAAAASIPGAWALPVFTFNPAAVGLSGRRAEAFEAEIVRVFKRLAAGGYVYKGLRPTLWSPTSRTALADTEIEYHDHVSKAIYCIPAIAFAIALGKRVSTSTTAAHSGLIAIRTGCGNIWAYCARQARLPSSPR